MKVGDFVKHKDSPEYGTGRILMFYPSHGTVLVSFENLKGVTYHIPWVLEKV